jgi:hypothetical protein
MWIAWRPDLLHLGESVDLRNDKGHCHTLGNRDEDGFGALESRFSRLWPSNSPALFLNEPLGF